MKLPWSRRDGRIEELEQKLEELEEERQRLEKRFEAEKERRSELSTKKQEAEEKLNRLRDRIESLESRRESDETEDSRPGFRRLDLGSAKRLLEKLGSLESPEEDLLTVYSGQELEKIDDLKGLKNSVNREQLDLLERDSATVAFLDRNLPDIVIETRPFFRPEWFLSDCFRLEKLEEFIREEKTWVLVSAGESEVWTEQNGEAERVARVTSRVDRKHSSGGFSQDRFAKKREEQIENHLQELEEEIGDSERPYLLGERDLCSRLPGERLGGFDPNAPKPDVFYSFRIHH